VWHPIRQDAILRDCFFSVGLSPMQIAADFDGGRAVCKAAGVSQAQTIGQVWRNHWGLRKDACACNFGTPTAIFHENCPCFESHWQIPYISVKSNERCITTPRGKNHAVAISNRRLFRRLFSRWGHTAIRLFDAAIAVSRLFIASGKVKGVVGILSERKRPRYCTAEKGPAPIQTLAAKRNVQGTWRTRYKQAI